MQIKPTNSTIYITDKCNSRCRSCRAWKNKSHTQYLTDQWFSVLYDLYELGISYIGFSGGEPLLRTDIIELIKKSKQIGFRFIDLSTNGILLDSERIKKLSDAGLDRIILSIDGVGAVHDKLRGIPGSYLKIERTLHEISKSAIECIVQTNIVNENIKDVSEIISITEKHGMHWGMNIINDTQYQFKGIPKDKFLDFNSDDLKALMNLLEEKLKNRKHRILLKNQYLPILEKVFSIGGIPSNIPCITGFNHLYLNEKMDIFPGCTAMPPVGNALKSSINEIINSSTFRKRVINMFNRKCPGCTCGLFQNLEYYFKKMG